MSNRYQQAILLFNTIKHLKVTQILYQLKNRVCRVGYAPCCAPLNDHKSILAYHNPKPTCYKDNSLTFINITAPFTSWNDTQHGMLWAYNLNYMDWLLQEGMSFEQGAVWIERFIEEIESNRVGLDPYPIALRSINWIKFIALHREKIGAEQRKRWNDSLYSQCKLLERKLEFHLLGNHLLEDSYALFFASLHFGDEALFRKSSKLLLLELREQTLSDGAHFEQSPMYHSILLDRLLDCYNISLRNPLFEAQNKVTDELRCYAEKTLSHLQSIKYSDNTLPLLNDSAEGIAPTVPEIVAYADSLGLKYSAQPLGASGYRKMQNSHFEAIVDIGNVEATYQAGHTHADTFTFELRANNQPFIVDTGISTYNKNERRAYERSTAAHNTVSVEGANSSQVWSGFRVARRAKVSIHCDSSSKIEASHNGFGSKGAHRRCFEMGDNQFFVTDSISRPCDAVSYIHFAPSTKILGCDGNTIESSQGKIIISGATKIELEECFVSSEYNRLEPTTVAAIHFCKSLEYKILPL